MKYGLVSASVAGNLRQLEPLARVIFGDGDRPLGWFARKLERERVEPGLSWLVTRKPSTPADPKHWVGYGLVGTPRSLGPAARTAGIGLAPGFRRCGLGARLVNALAACSKAAGYRALLTEAHPRLVPFYTRLGYRAARTSVALLSFGAGGKALVLPGTIAASPTSPRAGWLPEAWSYTPTDARWTQRIATPTGEVALDIAAEGEALACHQLRATSEVSTDDCAQALWQWRESAPTGKPLLVLGLPGSGSLTASLRGAGWDEVQRTVLCQRRLG